MATLFWLMVASVLGFAWFSASRAAAERAEEVGRNACHASGVQWLDQSVHASGMRFRRGNDGRFGLERTFRFEYSDDGEDRHVGRLVLRGGKLVAFVGPTRRSSPVI